jgi:hypothetical protein
MLQKLELVGAFLCVKERRPSGLVLLCEPDMMKELVCRANASGRCGGGDGYVFEDVLEGAEAEAGVEGHRQQDDQREALCRGTSHVSQG